MTSLSSKQLHVLKSLRKTDIHSIDGLKGSVPEILLFLNKCGYVDLEMKTPGSSNRSDITDAKISQLGLSYLHDRHVVLLAFWIPTFISLCALVISIFSLCHPYN